MGTTLNRQAYEQLLEEDLTWLMRQPRTLERDHVEAIVKRSAELEYASTTSLPLTAEQSPAKIRGVIETLCNSEFNTIDPNEAEAAISELMAVAIPAAPTRNDIYLEAIRAVEAARDDWKARGRKHWWPAIAQEVIGVLRTRAAAPSSSPSDATVATSPVDDFCYAEGDEGAKCCGSPKAMHCAIIGNAEFWQSPEGREHLVKCLRDDHFIHHRFVASPSSPVVGEADDDSEAVQAEQGRWQNAIREHLVKESGLPGADSWIDGVGCDSGDPLDLSLAEISQVLNRFIDAASGAKSEPDVAGLASQIWDSFRDYRNDGGGVPTQEEIEQLLYRIIRATILPSTSIQSTASPVLDFEKWVLRWCEDNGRKLSITEYGIAMTAFYAAHPSEGPHSITSSSAQSTARKVVALEAARANDSERSSLTQADAGERPVASINESVSSAMDIMRVE